MVVDHFPQACNITGVYEGYPFLKISIQKFKIHFWPFMYYRSSICKNIFTNAIQSIVNMPALRCYNIYISKNMLFLRNFRLKRKITWFDTILIEITFKMYFNKRNKKSKELVSWCRWKKKDTWDMPWLQEHIYIPLKFHTEVPPRFTYNFKISFSNLLTTIYRLKYIYFNYKNQ